MSDEASLTLEDRVGILAEVIRLRAKEDGDLGPSIHQLRVRQFMLQAGQETPNGGHPVQPTEEERKLAATLVLEEAFETVEALGFSIRLVGSFDEDSPLSVDLDCELRPDKPFDMVKAIDGACDTIVVSTGVLSRLGVDDRPFQALIDKSNLEKFGPGSYRREDGKWIKPENWKEPDIAGALKRLYGWEDSNADSHDCGPEEQSGTD